MKIHRKIQLDINTELTVSEIATEISLLSNEDKAEFFHKLFEQMLSVQGFISYEANLEHVGKRLSERSSMAFRILANSSNSARTA